jgi:hypothetical protein
MHTVLLASFLHALVPHALANSGGKTGAGATPQSCNGSCHSGGATPTVTLTGPVGRVEPGSLHTLTLRVRHMGGVVGTSGAGLNVATSAGTLSVTEASGTKLQNGQVTHTGKRAINEGADTVRFEFGWTAPPTAGSVTLQGWGNAVNGAQGSAGDLAALASLTIDVASCTPTTEAVGDGIDQDCDGGDLCLADGDGDGVGGVGTVASRDLDCADVGEAVVGADCDDGAASVYPGAREAIGDGVDQDCDGGEVCLADVDGDRFGGFATVDSRDLDCADVGEAGLGGDCDDADGMRYPGAPEGTADGIDSDCDGGDTCYADMDGDGFGGADRVVRSDDLDCADPGEYAGATDCDDTSMLLSPGAVEQCDPLDRDEDCNGVSDDEDVTGAGMPYAVGTIRYWVDADGDGVGSGQASYTCEEERVPPGAARVGGDCDDSRGAVHPGAFEACDATEDLNCDGAFGSVDGDGDGFSACTDCDDTRADANPAAAETCNGADDDCDGVLDEPDAADAQAFHLDADLDGFGDGATAVTACAAPSGYVSDASDCDDDDDGVYPSAPEVAYDGLDQDCDGGDLCDQDLDGFGACAGEDDCDDLDTEAFPGADEIVGDGIDQDCDGVDALPPEDTGVATDTSSGTDTSTGTSTTTETATTTSTATGTGTGTEPTVTDEDDEEARKAGAFGWLGCATGAGRPGVAPVLGLMALLGLRRRRRG